MSTDVVNFETFGEVCRYCFRHVVVWDLPEAVTQLHVRRTMFARYDDLATSWLVDRQQRWEAFLDSAVRRLSNRELCDSERCCRKQVMGGKFPRQTRRLSPYSEKFKILSNSITYYPLLKCPIAKWFCGLRTRVNFHLAKLLAVDVILYHSAFLSSFRGLSL